MEQAQSGSQPFSLLTFLQDGEDFRLLQGLLDKTKPSEYTAVWEPDTAHALEKARTGGFDVVLMDDRGGPKPMVAFLREARRKGVTLPLVVLTQRPELQPLQEYIDAGADDSIPRERLNPFVLERTLRQAVVHRRTLGLAYESENRFHKLLSSLSEAVLLHHNGELLECNDATAKLFGYELRELPGLTLASFFAPEARTPIAQHEASLSSEPLETSGLRKDGQTFPLSIHSRPFQYQNRDARLLTFTDLTGLKDRDQEIEYLLQRLRQDNEKSMKSDRLKEEFLSSISGDLRSPLTAIVGYLRLLKMEGLGPLSTSQMDAVESADKNARRLSSLVDDLLDLSRLDPGAVPLDYHEILSDALADEALEAAKPLAESKEIRLIKEVAPGTLVADPVKIARVLSHLLGNSIKFTQVGGTVSLGSHPWKEGQHPGWLFYVKDSGVGIPEEELERVFDHFYRMDDAVHHASSGSGVGLAVSRRIVEAHGGRIWAESMPKGPGVVFKVFLPQTAAL